MPPVRAVVFVLSIVAFPVHALAQHPSIYFYGYLKHFNPGPQVHEGGMKLLGVSMELRYGKFQFDTGVATYVDSYSKRSYGIFTNVSHDTFRYAIFTPMIFLTCTRKGKSHDTNEMTVYCFPVPKVRIGKQTGPFADVGVFPKVSDYTNGWISIEFGYKW